MRPTRTDLEAATTQRDIVAESRARNAVPALTGAEKMYELLTHPEAYRRIAPLLVPGGTPDDKADAWERVVANTMRASRNDPNIEKCRGTTILDSVATIVGAWHLDLGETAYLVPFKEKDGSYTCTAIMGYTGMAQLMLASGAVRRLNTWCYYTNEEKTGNFKVTAGTNSGIFHIPMPHKTRGKLAGAYVVALVRGQVEMWSYMALEDIEIIRANSRGWNPRLKGLVECPEWYAKKTALRQFAKLIPKSRELMRAFKAIRQDEIAEHGEYASLGDDETAELAAPVTRSLQPASVAPVDQSERETFNGSTPRAEAPEGPDVPEPEWQDDRDLDDDDRRGTR